MPSADNTPDFDSMSPEELMVWMESLAKRQGVDVSASSQADAPAARPKPNSWRRFIFSRLPVWLRGSDEFE